MTRWFNTVGVCQSEQHYSLTAKERLPQVKALVEKSACFWVYGPRQTGKTTTMRQWALDFTKRGKYAAVLVSASSLAEGQFEKEGNAIAEESFLYELRESAFTLPEDCQPPDWGYQVAGQQIRTALSTWAEACPRPLVVFIDDVETLDGRSLTSLLRQLWSGITHRPRPFPQSIALIGLQDVNSIPIKSTAWTPGNVFHKFRTTSLPLRSFTLEEVANLYQKHTDTTGQLFTLEAVDRAFELTQGQPWLVNAVAQHAIGQTQAPIEPLHIEAAATDLLDRQRHAQILPLDHLPSQLIQFQELLAPILSKEIGGQPSIQQLAEMTASGLCRRDATGGIVIANPLYHEVIMQQLALPPIASLGSLEATWLNGDGTISIDHVWDAFVGLWQAQGDALMQTVSYGAIAPYLAAIAFFHRLTQPHGTLKAAYGFQQQQMQLIMALNAPAMSVSMIAQVMVWKQGQSDPIERGLSQLEQLRSQSSVPASSHPAEPYCCLIIIDQQRDRRPCNERTHMESITTATGLSLPVIRG